MSTNLNFDHLRLKLAIRKTLLALRDHEYYRTGLMVRYPWAPKELFEAVIADCVAEGTITEKKGRNDAVIYVWHEEAIR